MANVLKGMGLMGAGAYGYQQVQSNELLGNLNRMMGMFDASDRGSRTASSSGRAGSSGGEVSASLVDVNAILGMNKIVLNPYVQQMEVLQGEVDRLHQLLSDVVRGNRQSGHTVIHTGGRSGWSFYVYPVVGAGLVYVYCRIRGLSVFDLLYVSQNSMTQFKSTVTEGFARIWDEVRKQKDEMMAKLGMVGRKQEQLIENQAQMDERLRQVGDNVDDVKANTHNINFRVTMLDGKLSEVRDGMTNVHQGIMLLVQTVAEVTNRIGMNNTRSSQALKGYLSNSSVPAAALPAGQQQPYMIAGNGSATPSSMGLNLLLENTSDEGTAGLVDSCEPAPVPPATAPLSRSEASKGAGGPPSFPKVPASKPSSMSGAFWGMGRT